MSARVAVLVARATILAATLVAWEVAARPGGGASLVAPPSAIAGALSATVLRDEAIRSALFFTLFEVLCAYALAVAVGLVLGLAIGATEMARRTFYPVVLLLYAIPQVVLLPLVTLVFGIGPAAKIAFGFSHGVFPVLVNVVAGMRNVNPLYARAATAMGARRADIVRQVIFPNMATSFFTGLRLAMTTTLLGVILAELYVSTAGVGYFTRLFAENFDPAPLFALIGILAIMAIGLNELMRGVERRFTHWRTTSTS